MKFAKLFLFIALLSPFLFVSAGQARVSAFTSKQSEEQFGISPGVMSPHDLSGVDQNEREVNLEKLSGRNGIVLYFMRSANWSRHCSFQLENISRRGSMIEDAGYNIVVVSNESVGALARFTRKYDFPYPMIADTNSEIIRAFEIMNEAYLPKTSYYGVAYPAIYVIGRDGLVIDKFFNTDISMRPNVDEVRSAIDLLGDYTPVTNATE
jgi:peroxiredoxin Q/BCP